MLETVLFYIYGSYIRLILAQMFNYCSRPQTERYDVQHRL